MSKEINEAARIMGRKGGKARNKHLTKERITEIARNAGLASAKSRKKLYEQQQQDNTKASA